MDVYASGNWLVKEGKEEDFVRAWRSWFEWSRDHAPGLRGAILIRSMDDPRRFVSMSTWESEKARADWMATDEFRTSFAGAKALTDEFVGGQYAGVLAL
jgi:heme-degrading monooxygenase HmoA